MEFIGVLVIALIIFVISMILLLMIIKSNIYEKELEDKEQVVWLKEWEKKRYEQTRTELQGFHLRACIIS